LNSISALLPAALILLVCNAARGEQDVPAYQSVLIEGIPHVRQKPDFCGEACAEMVLAKLGQPMDQDFVFDQSGLDPAQGRGCYTRELARALRRIGFRTGAVWYRAPPAGAERQLQAQFRALHADLVAGVPSIACMHYDQTPGATEHFRLIVGYDAKTDEVIYHEPAVDRGAYRRMTRDRLFALWPLKYEPRRWTVVRLRLEPGRLIAGRTATTLTGADYAQHVLALKQKLQRLRETQVERKKQRDAEIAAEIEREKQAKAEEKPYERKQLAPRMVSDFHIVIQKPFVVIGDGPLAGVRRWAQGTIRWAVGRLKRDYFSKDPDHVIDVWLFKDRQSYEQNVFDLFGSRPHTPFGYYSSWQKALIMNIGTGGGTLVHEIVHPFMAANFPQCPSWFNEGLGSLYEQSREKNGHIWGLTNWRLRGLQEAIKDEDGQMPTFQQLCRTDDREFYDEDPGTNYAQARYLCYYLQQQGLLVKYYHAFHGSAQDDPTGYETLKQVLGDKGKDMAKFQQIWAEYVMKLRY